MAVPEDALLAGLNPEQREAVEHVDGPLLVIAGPGSGKTRVITHRVAYLVKHVGISPYRVCTVTFTNRAARELRERMERLLGTRAEQLFAGTFHSLCAMILRREGEVIGLKRDFVIMDDDDQMDLIKRSMEIAQLDPKRFPPRTILSAISSAKSQLQGPDAYALGSSGYYDEIVRRIYRQYQELLDRSHGVDFDDLLAKTIELFRRAPEARNKYQDRFVHMMVDEFQDTNIAQYQIARELAGKYQNLAVVGDPDQSIYSWRNADIRNILSFQEDYPSAKTVRLSRNYRSTGIILDAAQRLIASNRRRLEQQLVSENERGTPVMIAETYNDEEEAQTVLQEIDRLTREEEFTLRDCVVTFRVNAQSRALEEACLRYGVPYKLVGGVRFYQRREVKDVLAYLRLVQDPYDEVSLTRVINVPTRGIGKRTVDDLMAWAQSMNVPAYAALQLLAGEAAEPLPLEGRGQGEGDAPTPHPNLLPHGEKELYVNSPFNARQRQQLVDFLALINGLREGVERLDVPHLIDEVMERSGYRKSLLESGEPDAEDRLDNIRELRGVAADTSGEPAADALQPFLESAALVSEQDALVEEEEQQYLTLITLHQIKGLEYPVVFMVGLEEGVLPHMRSLDDPDQLEEERRLTYVGMTRAKKRLYLFRAFRRRLSGAPRGNAPSRFLSEIPAEFVKTPGRKSSRYEDRRTETPIPVGRRYIISEPAPTAAGPAPFNAGDKVVHGSFGKGIVVSCKPTADDFEVTVAFTGDSGVKRLLSSFAKLDKVV